MDIRQPAVSGLFYPDQPDRLSACVSDLLEGASEANTPPIGLVVPHAGYIYSGPVAASAYRSLKAIAASTGRVVLLGPAHRIPLRGVAAPGCRTFATPLGHIPLDLEAIAGLVSQYPEVAEIPEAHAGEHSLEVQLPFLQSVLHDFTLIPLVVGECDPATLARIIGQLWREDTVVIVSSDLSHYLPYASAQEKDRATSAAIENLDATLTGDQACGCRPLNGLLTHCRDQGWRINTIDLRNSGDTAGDRRRVVGYGAYVVHRPD